MELLRNLGITSLSGFFGLALLVIGGFMILAGVGIISIQQVTVKQGRATWIMGLVMAVVGVFLLYPELAAPSEAPEGPAAVVDTNSPAVVDASPAATLQSSDATGGSSAWRTIEFAVPGNGLWLEEDGRYTAIGSKDTIAWSDDLFAGDIEVSLEVESLSSFSAANVILYGNGVSLAPGNLIFTIASDQQSILADSIYDNGTYLFTSMSSLSFGEQKHTVLISIVDRKASLFLDGEETASILLDENINTSGRIGLLKYWEIHDVIYASIRVRDSGSIK
jgi:hypothetical protein